MKFSDLTSEELHAVLLEWRDVEPANACDACAGSGKQTYGNTATWTDATIAGQALTVDVCDKCWGSGDKTRPWTNLRSLHAEYRLARQRLLKLADEVIALEKKLGGQ